MQAKRRSLASHLTLTTLFQITLVIFSILLLFRGVGLYPVVFGDEFLYNLSTRLTAIADAARPNYLFFLLYRLTNTCGDGYLACARILNVIFFTLSAPFIYLIARKYVGQATAILIALLALLDPLNAYATFFMPESFYYFSFWVANYFIINLDSEKTLGTWVRAGAVLGLSALVKPHAIFLLPALCVYFLFILCRAGTESKAARAGKYFGFFASAVFVKLAIGFLLAGRHGLTLFGESYSSIAADSVSGVDHFLNLGKLALEILPGHVLSLSILFSVPLAFLILSLLHVARHGLEKAQDSKIFLFTGLLLFSLLFIIAFFSASVSSSGPFESVNRLHMRYYNFIFPLFYLMLLPQMSAAQLKFSLHARFIAGGVISALVVYGISSKLAPFIPNFVDSPEVRGLTLHRSVFYTIGALSLLATLAWIYNSKLGTRFFIYLFMPIAQISICLSVNSDLRGQLISTNYDDAGLFARKSLDVESQGKTIILGTDPSGLTRTQFYFDSPDTSNQLLKPGEKFDFSKAPAGKEWILEVGDAQTLTDLPFKISTHDFTLGRFAGADEVDFKKSTWLGVVSYISGVSASESGSGTWSNGPEVLIRFVRPLPARFELQLVAHAFGAIAGKAIFARVGTQTSQFSLSDRNEEKILVLNNPEGLHDLQFDVPATESPKSLGLSEDSRILGINFNHLKIVPLTN